MAGFTLTELAKMVGVNSAQFRDWKRRGYTEPIEFPLVLRMGLLRMYGLPPVYAYKFDVELLEDESGIILRPRAMGEYDGQN